MLSRLGLFRELFSSNNGNQGRGSFGRQGSGQGGGVTMTTLEKPLSSPERSKSTPEATISKKSELVQRRVTVARASKPDTGGQEREREGYSDDEDSASSMTSSSDEQLRRRKK